MLLKQGESLTRQPQRFYELKPDGDSFQPPSCPSTSRASPQTPPWARTWKPPQMWFLLAEQWQHQSVLLPSSFISCWFSWVFPGAFLFQNSRQMHLYRYKQGRDVGDTRTDLPLPLRLWGSPPSRMNGGLEERGHRIAANAIYHIWNLFFFFFKRTGNLDCVFAVHQTASCGASER